MPKTRRFLHINMAVSRKEMDLLQDVVKEHGLPLATWCRYQVLRAARHIVALNPSVHDGRKDLLREVQRMQGEEGD